MSEAIRYGVGDELVHYYTLYQARKLLIIAHGVGYYDVKEYKSRLAAHERDDVTHLIDSTKIEWESVGIKRLKKQSLSNLHTERGYAWIKAGSDTPGHIRESVEGRVQYDPRTKHTWKEKLKHFIAKIIKKCTRKSK